LELKSTNFGVAAGVIWGLSCFLMAFLGQYSLGLVTALGKLYIGYSEGIVGAVFGFVYGFLDAFIFFFLIATVYNYLNKSEKKK